MFLFGFIINEDNTSRFPDDKEHKEIRVNMNTYNSSGLHYFFYKWGGTKPDLALNKGSWQQPGWLINWPSDMKENNPTHPRNTQYIKYPFFEKNIKNIENKGYITDGNLSKIPHNEILIQDIK